MLLRGSWHFQGKELRQSAEGSLLQVGPARDMSLCGLPQKHVASRERDPDPALDSPLVMFPGYPSSQWCASVSP